jgi:dolichol-phosphate mannosyltransferase
VPKNLTLVIIPTYNEAESIGSLLQELTALPVDILIVDDGSADATVRIAHEFDTSGERINFLLRTSKLGLGSAYRAGYAWAAERDYMQVVQMDADGSHQVSDLAKMLEFVASHSDIELLIGSRWIKGGAIENWSRRREALSRIANLYTRSLLRLGINDVTAGFRIYQASLLERMNIQSVKSEGYSFQIEMSIAARKAGATITEFPITFKEREQGVSKMSGRIIFEAITRVTLWGIKGR